MADPFIKLKTFKACGKVMGHNEHCCEGWLCDACKKVKVLIEYTDFLEDKLSSQQIQEAQDDMLLVGLEKKWLRS